MYTYRYISQLIKNGQSDVDGRADPPQGFLSN